LLSGDDSFLVGAALRGAPLLLPVTKGDGMPTDSQVSGLFRAVLAWAWVKGLIGPKKKGPGLRPDPFPLLALTGLAVYGSLAVIVM